MPRINCPEVMRAKLAEIPRLTAGELTGWHKLVTGSHDFCRPPFSGEIEALERRARKLGLVLTARGYSRPSAKS